MRTLLLLVLLLAASGAAAQTSRPNHRLANRRALRDARNYPADAYKESHLAVNKATLKRGDGGRPGAPNDNRQKYKFDKTGTARVSEPSTLNLRLRKKKKPVSN